MLGLDPQSFREDFHDPIWKEAMDEEFDSLHDNQTWELGLLPPGRKLVQCKWIFNTKIVADGTTTKYKARWKKGILRYKAWNTMIHSLL